MTRQQAVERLHVSLTKVIDEWSDKQCESPEWEQMGYVGDDLCRMMAKAAMAVFEATANIQDWLEDHE